MSDYILSTTGKLYQCTNSDYLQHYGVVGMKWGKRKARYAEKDVRSAKYIESRANMIGRQNTRAATEKLKNVNAINSLKANKDRAGVKAEKKRYKLDSTIRSREDNKALNKLQYDHVINEAKIRRANQSNRFAKLKDVSLKNTLARHKKNYESSVKIDNYYIAKAKAKKNPDYKNSNEYERYMRDGRREVGKAYAQAFISAALQVAI